MKNVFVTLNIIFSTIDKSFMYQSTNKNYLLLCAVMAFSPCFAQEVVSKSERNNHSIMLDTIHIDAYQEKSPASEEKNREQLNQEMVSDNRDLLRYSTDVGLADSGRFQKGFALRGVEGNRVGIYFDGVDIPSSEENSLYARYGNYNSSRIAIDPELARSVDIVKAADSYDAGSGALGGSINYRSLDVYDIVQDGAGLGGLLRGGYASKNRQWFSTTGLGYVSEAFDVVGIFSHRNGHELKSAGGGEKTQGAESQHPDPASHHNNNYLLKLNYHFNSEHHIGIGATHQRMNSFTNERSYNLFGSAWREANDHSELTTANLYYEWTPYANGLDALKLEYDYQKSDLAAVGYKGVRNWSTDAKELDEIYDRNFASQFHRLTLSAQTQPLVTGWGEHRFSLATYASARDFKVLNIDTINIHSNTGKGLSPDVITQTIQYPTRTTQYGIKIKDDIFFNDVFSAEVGVRYDHTKIAPRTLNAPCTRACLAEGKPIGQSFNTLSGLLGLNAQINDTWTADYHISTGYRIPTASEMFFTFTNPYGTWKSNRDLAPERSVNQTIAIKGHSDLGSADITFYHNRYRDFLFEQTSLIEQTQYGRTWQTPMNQMVNLDKAHITGLEIGGAINLDQVLPVAQGWRLSGNVGYSQGKLSNRASLLSIQPVKAVIGLDYEQADEDWGIFSRLTYFGSKKASDAQVENVKSRCLLLEYDPWFGQDICKKTELYKEVEDFKYLNKSAFVFDVFGYYKPTKNLTLRAGVYNVLNHKYHTWDALRGINRYSTVNTVDRNDLGLQRFYAPGRNFSVTFNYTF